MESIMKKLALAIGMVSIAVAASVTMADPGGYGMGMGPGCGAAAGANCPYGGGPGGYGPGYGRGGGYGPGAGQGPGGGYGRGGGQGMALLTPEERAQHREAMHSLTSVEQCNAYMAEHRQLLLERAKEKGVAPPPGPRGDMCERMKARGMFG
jgi:hypothetical protein